MTGGEAEEEGGGAAGGFAGAAALLDRVQVRGVDGDVGFLVVVLVDDILRWRDEHGNIASDPNRADDEEYIVRLVGQVITVSLETTKIVASLPALTHSG